MIEHDDEMFSILLFLWTDDSVIKESENQVVVVLSEDVVHGTGKKNAGARTLMLLVDCEVVPVLLGLRICSKLFVC
jgi:hypothetical protein